MNAPVFTRPAPVEAGLIAAVDRRYGFDAPAYRGRDSDRCTLCTDEPHGFFARACEREGIPTGTPIRSRAAQLALAAWWMRELPSHAHMAVTVTGERDPTLFSDDAAMVWEAARLALRQTGRTALGMGPALMKDGF